MRRTKQTLTDRLDMAIARECEEIRKHPTHPDLQLCRRNQTWIVAATLLQSGDYPAAAQAAAEMITDAGERWQDCYDAACLTAGCAALAADDQSRPAQERAQLSRSYASQAVGFLKKAVANGFREYRRLAIDPDLKPLRSHTSFRSLLQRAKLTRE